jgi:hypothetical protein
MLQCGYLDGAYIFTHMLQVFYQDIVYVCNCFQAFFMCVLQVFQTHVLSVSFALRHVFQTLHLDVSKVDQV